jgi:hypothetical protein
MTRRSRLTGRAEFSQSMRELAAAKQAAIAALSELTAARAAEAANPPPGTSAPMMPRTAAARASAMPNTTLVLEKKLIDAQRRVAEIGARIAADRERALGAETGFEQLSGAHPLLLLPLRLETRFAWMDGGILSFKADPALEQMLLVRIYPDEIHEDSHEPELTANEARWCAEFRRKLLAASDLKPIEEAWAELIRRAGAPRAAWLGQLAIAASNPGKRPGVFSRPSLARLLPDRWVAYATLVDGTMMSAVSAPVREPLEMGPAVEGIDWMTNFAAAEKAGMALKIRALPAEVTEIRRLIVVGACSTLDPTQTQSALEQLLDAHHFTRGLDLLPPGTPTNSSPGSRAGFSSRPALADVIAIEQRRYQVGGRMAPLCQRGDRSDGTELATALGIQPATFAYTARADATESLDGMQLRTLLAAVVRRPLTNLLAGILDPATVDELLAFACDRVAALGPFTYLRVGNQPYGLLPVMLTDEARSPGSNAARYLPALDRLRAHWQAAEANLDFVGKPGVDPGDTLIRILQRDGVAGRIAFRPLLGPQTGQAAAAGLTARAAKTLTAQREAAAAMLHALGARQANAAPLLQTMLLPSAPPLGDPMVENPDAAAGSIERAANYLEMIATLRPENLAQHDYPGGERPRSLLFALARLAMLELADARAREVLIAAGANSARWNDESPPSYALDPLATPLRRLQAPDPADPLATIGFHLSTLGRDAGYLQWMRDVLRHFATCAPAAIELQLRASLGLFSNRLDAWYTALAVDRLREVRSDVTTAAGLNAGAYGVLENISRAPRQPVAGTPGLFTIPTNGGYIHAPSVNHGAAAAVLRSVHLAHAAAGRGASFSVDLSSERVRRALPLIEGIRGGQPLAALLGYRIERELAVEGLQRYIAPFRAIAPLLANMLTPSMLPAESVAASNVVDGLTLLEKAGYDGERPATVDTLWTRNSSLGATLAGDDYLAMQRVLAAAESAIDAVSDLVLAEGVFQAVQGNPARVGAAADSVAGAPVPPAEMHVARTPRAGVAATYRILTLLDAAAGVATGWATTPRAAFEPRLEAWCAQSLPPPDRICVRAAFRRADGTIAATFDTPTLGSLFERAADAQREELLFSALDLVALADPRDTPQRSALEVRLMALLELERPAAAGDAPLELVYARDPAWDATQFGVVETLEIGAQLRNLIGHARPLQPADFALPGADAALVVVATEHAARAADAARALQDARTVLLARAAGPDAAALRAALFAVDAFGVTGAAPISLRDAADARAQTQLLTQLRAQALAVDTEIARRLRRFDEGPADDAGGRLKAIFGEGFTTLPIMTGMAGQPVSLGTTPGGAGGAAIRAWVARAARVREGVRLLDGALGMAEAIAMTRIGGAAPSFGVRQLGGPAGEAWIALPLSAGASLPGGRVSVVALGAELLPLKAVAGLFIDEWLEVVPAATQTTSVAFHYEAPSSAPPQVMLLGVPTPGVARWSADAARRLVVEALDLGRIRLVDMEDLAGLGQLLPAFVTEENTGGDAFGLDVEVLTRKRGT